MSRPSSEDLADRTRLEQVERAERERAESKVLQALTPVQEALRTMQPRWPSWRLNAPAVRRTQPAAFGRPPIRGKLRATTESLASALRSNSSSRGVWGETQLPRVVESAGLIDRVDFNLQSSSCIGCRRGPAPTWSCSSPDRKSIAVDAKVPYNAFLEASQIPATATGEEEARRKTLLTRARRAGEGPHRRPPPRPSLGRPRDSPEFTVAFIPSEPLLATALESDPALLDYAFSKKLPSPRPSTCGLS